MKLKRLLSVVAPVAAIGCTALASFAQSSGGSGDFAFPTPSAFQTTVLDSVGPYWIAGITVGVAIAGVLMLRNAIVRKKRLSA
jgi:hypothetical protein